jgi:hypothetical protein
MIASHGSLFVEFSGPETGITGSLSSIDELAAFSSYLPAYGSGNNITACLRADPIRDFVRHCRWKTSIQTP